MTSYDVFWRVSNALIGTLMVFFGLFNIMLTL